MPVEFDERGPAISDTDIDAFEARIGHELPDDYRAFLRSLNGGVPRHHVIRHTQVGDLGVQLFFGICDREHLSIDAERQAMQCRWPSRFLSIAINDFGNRFCLSLELPDLGSVYFWNHEEEAEEGEEPTEFNLYPLAKSFAAFWERIEEIDRDVYMAEKAQEVKAEAPRSDTPPPIHTNGEPH